MATSNALKRVIRAHTNPTAKNGIWFTNNQLLELSNHLSSIGAAGAAFMIGKSGNKKSVEVIPFSGTSDLDTQIEPTLNILNEGNLSVSLKRLPGSVSPFAGLIDNNGGGGGGNQKTPPPSINP